MADTNLLQKIINKKDRLPKKQKEFSDYILENYRELGIQSIGKMSENSGVGTTTILRTIRQFGYDNLNDFKRDIHLVVIDSQTPKWWDFSNEDEEADTPNDNHIQKTWSKINQLQQYTMTKDLEKTINAAVKRMTEAERINVFGLRTSRSVALYLENSINEFNPVCQQLSYEPNFIFDRLYHVSDKEVVILIALSPFTKMTYEVAKYCAEKNIDVILITDSADNSMIPYAKHVLMLARSGDHYSLVPAISLVETLTVIFGSTVNQDSAENLKEVGRLIVDKDITMT